jgi:hypothetical protein
MATRPEEHDRIVEALEGAARVDATDVLVEGDGQTVVLRGAVATFEEATLAAAIAEQHSGDGRVRNELRVDPNLREDPTSDRVAVPQGGPTGDRTGSSVLLPDDTGDELVDDIGDAVAENLPWDPPEHPTEVPTLAEERGVVDHDVTAVPAADAGPLPPDEAEATAPSLGELSQQELARAASPTRHDEER